VDEVLRAAFSSGRTGIGAPLPRGIHTHPSRPGESGR
jgi:hypothetical protein